MRQPRNRDRANTRGETLALSRTEVQRLRQAMQERTAEYRNREIAAEALGLKKAAVEKVMVGKVPTFMTRSMLDDVGRVLGLDVRLWGGGT